VFEHDPETNRLSIKPGHDPPWRRPNTPQGDQCTWQYCTDCHAEWVAPPDNRKKGHTTLRDKASQGMMRPTWRSRQQREEALAEARQGIGEHGDGAYLDGAAADDEADADAALPPDSEPESERAREEAAALERSVLADGRPDEDGESSCFDDNDGVLPAMPPERRPSLQQYEAKWAGLLAKHSKHVDGDFSLGNLVPKPIHELWQDCPYVPFDKLVSEEAQARLSVCKPISGFQESTREGVERFAHNSGSVFFQKRSPLQLTSTLGFVLNKDGGQFLNLKAPELDALHEVLTWGRQPGNNKILAFFGQTLEDFSGACGALMQKFKHLLPTGSTRVTVRVTGRDRLNAKEGNLGQTLGEESVGMVVADYDGNPLRYNQLGVYDDIVAQHRSVRFDVEAVHDDLREKLSGGVHALRDDTFVKANDPHYEAKVFPCHAL